ncbi:MAG TPA: hypothetical protein VNN80_30620 [Polyangiaceae bacterium]|nr:hypothetical protein [Polyangiaceae bacterium]
MLEFSDSSGYAHAPVGMLHERQSSADACPRAASDPVAGTRRGARAVAVTLIASTAAMLWLLLATWRLDRVPGMSLDEAWSILSARGQWPPHDPLSGMTSYAGPFPVLLLELFGTEHGVAILRGASVVCNAAALVLLGLLLRRLHPGRGHVLWALPMIASCPVWLVVLRTGIEVVMFTPLLVVLGLYLFGKKTRWAAFGAGLAWGLLVYNHLVGACFALALALAWRIAHRGWPALPWRLVLAGGALGLAPRLLALALYHDQLIEGTAQGYSLLPALGDLRWVPICAWRTWHGDTVYLRYVGGLAHEPWPYGLLGVVFVLPWFGRWRQVPATAWFTLLAAVLSAALVTLAAPYIAVRFSIVPIAGLTAFLAVLGAAAIERDARWRAPIIGAALAATGLNLYFCVSNFYVPWRDGKLALTTFWLGDRSKRTGNWAYFPKEGLVEELGKLEPAPEQVLTVPTLERPLRVLLDGTPIRVKLPPNADPALRSVYVDYRKPEALGPHCVEVPGGRFCFGAPAPVAEHYLLYR